MNCLNSIFLHFQSANMEYFYDCVSLPQGEVFFKHHRNLISPRTFPWLSPTPSKECKKPQMPLRAVAHSSWKTWGEAGSAQGLPRRESSSSFTMSLCPKYAATTAALSSLGSVGNTTNASFSRYLTACRSPYAAAMPRSWHWWKKHSRRDSVQGSRQRKSVSRAGWVYLCPCQGMFAVAVVNWECHKHWWPL